MSAEVFLLKKTYKKELYSDALPPPPPPPPKRENTFPAKQWQTEFSCITQTSVLLKIYSI